MLALSPQHPESKIKYVMSKHIAKEMNCITANMLCIYFKVVHSVYF
jgi:hypothetical protein